MLSTGPHRESCCNARSSLRNEEKVERVSWESSAPQTISQKKISPIVGIGEHEASYGQKYGSVM